MANVNILGVNINNITKEQALNKIGEYLNGQGQHQIVTPNPEILLEASHDQELFDILNKADLAVADGVALKFVAWVMGKNLHRVAGADLLKDILDMAQARGRPLGQTRGRRVAVFNWSAGLSSADEIERALAEKYPGLLVVAYDVERQPAMPEQVLEQARDFKPDIIFSALGAPWQEKFIFYNLPGLPAAKIGLGVGGSFDYLTGKLPRAPKLMRWLGLEWLWRLIKQPRRWRRIYNAVIVFPVKFIMWRLASRH